MADNNEAVRSHLEALRGKIEASRGRLSFAAGAAAPAVAIAAVTKKVPLRRVQEYIDACLLLGEKAIIAENYLQESEEKIRQLSGNFETHFIGRLQSNKVKKVVALFDVIETVDSLSLASLIAKEARARNKCQRIFLQVNISSDSAKGGFSAIEIPEVVEKITKIENLQLQGLMTITRLYENPEDARQDFAQLRKLRERLAVTYEHPIDLSMGMSQDFEIAVGQGATLVRIGTYIFGERQP